MTAVVSPVQSMVELRAWLTKAELMLRDMDPADPRSAAGFEVWDARHETYMARVLVESEPE